MRSSSIIVCCLTLALSFSNGNTRICFSCTNLRPGDTCEKAISCRDNEVCFTQKYKGEDNTTYYSLGCAYPELCRKDETGIVFGKRSFEHSHVLCHKCCQENVCNSKLECNDNYIGRSLKCLSCSGVSTPSQCTNTTSCGADESCFNRQNVHIPDVGKRTEVEVHLTCSACCDGNSLCNRYLDCNHTTQHTYNTSCVSNSECSSNFVCKFGICSCPNEEYYFGNDACYLYKTINQACLNSLQCKAPFSCRDKVCNCQPNQFSNGTACLTKKTILQPCNGSYECSNTLYCIHDVCNCGRLDYWDGQICSERETFNHSCVSDIDCKNLQKCESNKCICNQSFYNGKTCTLNRPYECDDLSITSSGVFLIYPIGLYDPKQVYCFLEGGTKWTVFQHRFDKSTNFYQTWITYKNGFGDPHGEYWLGPGNKTGYAEYSTFLVYNESRNYMLELNGYHGTAGDSLINVGQEGQANRHEFTTKDKDNDRTQSNCAVTRKSGWWFSNCEYADLNTENPNVEWDYNFGMVSSSLMMFAKS